MQVLNKIMDNINHNMRLCDARQIQNDSQTKKRERLNENRNLMLDKNPRIYIECTVLALDINNPTKEEQQDVYTTGRMFTCAREEIHFE